MKTFKRLCSLILCCAFLLSLVTIPAGAASMGVRNPDDYTDIKGHWAEEALRNLLSNGVMHGTTDTTTSPDLMITRAEMATLMVKAFEAAKGADLQVFTDIPANAWYRDFLSKAVQMGVISGNGTAMDPSNRITRQDAAVVFCKAFDLYGYTDPLTKFSDVSEISSYAKSAVAACVGAGIIQGVDGKLLPNQTLTRAEFATMLNKLVQHYVNSSVPFKGGNIKGSVMVTVPDATLKSSTISQNLYVGDGVDSGSLTLDNVRVEGTLYVRGGSKIMLKNGSYVKTLVIYNPSYAVSFETDTRSSVGTSVIDTAITGVGLSGNVGDVIMNTAKAELNLRSAKVGTLSANVILPTINIDRNTTVQKINIDVGATGANITQEGKVTNVNINAGQVMFKASNTSTTQSIQVGGSSSNSDASGCTVTVDRGGTINNTTVAASNFAISGNGSARRVTLQRGSSDASVSTPNTTVVNNSGSTVSVGNSKLSNGAIGTTNNSGTGLTTTYYPVTNPSPSTPTTPPVTQPKNSVLTFNFASSATATDIHISGNFTLAQLCSGMGYNSVMGTVTGTVYPVDQFIPMLGTDVETRYYVPMVLTSTDMTSSFILSVGNRTFTQADLSEGMAYRDKLVFFLPLNPSDASKTVTVTYDADGAGIGFNAVSKSVDYSSVSFAVSVDLEARSDLICGAPGINGGEALQVESKSGSAATSYTYNMKATALGKTESPTGVEAYWGGITFYGPVESSYAEYTVSIGTRSFSYSAPELAIESGSGKGYKIFNHYEDLAGISRIRVTITWYNEAGTVLSANEIYDFLLDHVVLADGTTAPEAGDQTSKLPVVESVSISKYPEDKLMELEEMSITQFATAYNVLDNGDAAAIAGTYHKVRIPDGSYGYYIPLKIEMSGLNVASILYVVVNGEKYLVGAINHAEGPDQTGYILLPLSALGTQVLDFSLVFESGSPNYITVTKAVDARQAAVDFENFSLEYAYEGDLEGTDISGFVASDYRFSANGVHYGVNGTFSLKDLSDIAEDYPYAEGYFAPVVFSNEQLTKEWVCTITWGDSANPYVHTFRLEAGTQSVVVFLPIGAYLDDSSYVQFDGIQVEFIGEEIPYRSIMLFSTTGCTLDGAPEDAPIITFTEAPSYSITTLTSEELATWAEDYDGEVTDLIVSDYVITEKLTEEGVEEGYALGGVYAKVSTDDGEMWVAPVKVVSSVVTDSFTITVGSEGEPIQSVDGSCIITLVLGNVTEEGTADTRVATYVLSIGNSQGWQLDGIVLDLSSAELEGFEIPQEPEPDPNPDPEPDPEPDPDPEKPDPEDPDPDNPTDEDQGESGEGSNGEGTEGDGN